MTVDRMGSLHHPLPARERPVQSSHDIWGGSSHRQRTRVGERSARLGVEVTDIHFTERCITRACNERCSTPPPPTPWAVGSQERSGQHPELTRMVGLNPPRDPRVENLSRFLLLQGRPLIGAKYMPILWTKFLIGGPWRAGRGAVVKALKKTLDRGGWTYLDLYQARHPRAVRGHAPQ